MNKPEINLDFMWHDNAPQEMLGIGSVAEVIEGHVPQSLIDKVFSAQDYAHGFNIGSPNDFSSLGETIITNGNCFSHDTSPKQRGLMYGENFVTSAMFAIPHCAKPNLIVHKSSTSSNLSLEDLNQQIFSEVKHAFVYIGKIEFAELPFTQIQKPPIVGENIFKYAEKYYAEPPQFYRDQACFVTGVASATAAACDKKLFEHLQVVLYEEPGESSSSLLMHAHGLLLKDATTKELTAPTNVIDVGHIIFAGSLIKSLELEVYLIKDVKILSF